MKTKGQDIVYCPNCGENKVQSQKGSSAIIGIIIMFIGACIPIVGWFILIPTGVICILISVIASCRRNSVDFMCQACKHKFKISKVDYKKYRNSIK